VVAFLEKDLSRPGPGVINGGIYVLKREILDLIHDLPCSLEQDVFPALVERGQIRGREFDGYFLDIGLPETLERGHLELPSLRARPAAFLDRNALIRFSDEDPEAFQWVRGVVEAIRALNDRGCYVFVLGSRSTGAGKTLAAGDAHLLSAAIQARLAPEGAHVDRFYLTPAFEDGVAPEPAIDAVERKPDAKPFVAAMDEWPIAPERSFFIGGRVDDIEVARSAGISGHIFDGTDLAAIVDSLIGRPVYERASARR
jgi:HAD superfamily hydrolase (TIGR01662 family)